MDLRIAARVSIPIVAAVAIGAVAVARRNAPDARVVAFTRAPAFVGNCDRQDMIALTDHLQGHDPVELTCDPGSFGERGVFVTYDDAMMLFAADGMREIAPSRSLPLERCWGAAFRVADLDGDGVDEIIMEARQDCVTSGPVIHEVAIRVIAIRGDHLVMSSEHRYPPRIDPMATARHILAHEPLD